MRTRDPSDRRMTRGFTYKRRPSGELGTLLYPYEKVRPHKSERDERAASRQNRESDIGAVTQIVQR
jgi:hypothetical protein